MLAARKHMDGMLKQTRGLRFTSRNCKICGLVTCLLIFGLSLCGLTIVGLRMQRLHATRAAIARMGGETVLARHTLLAVRQKKPQFQLGATATYLGNSKQEQALRPVLAWPRITEVRIDNAAATDQDLQPLTGLTSLVSLELCSDVASDSFLAAISRLPKLRRLKISGESFTVKGMLKLRESKSLEHIEFDPASFSAIEVAVIKMEIAGAVESRAIEAGEEVLPGPRRQSALVQMEAPTAAEPQLM